MGQYTIKDLEKLSGIKAHTIRIWEKRYGLIAPKRTNTNIRTYCDDELKKLLNISILNRNGYKISKIAQFTNNEIYEQINHLLQNNMDTETHLENLAIAMIDLDEAKFERILSRLILQLGFEDVVISILYPFFIRIGVMWQTGSIIPSQEHFITNLVKQKIIVAIDGILPSEKADADTYLVFLPEGELHELGLLFFSYLIKKRGHKLIYLGQTIPISDVIEAAKIGQADNIVTAFISGIDKKAMLAYIQKLTTGFPDKKVFLSGAQIEQLNGVSIPADITLIHSPKDFVDCLDKITV